MTGSAGKVHRDNRRLDDEGTSVLKASRLRRLGIQSRLGIQNGNCIHAMRIPADRALCGRLVGLIAIYYRAKATFLIEIR
jgi:hypothetical protein